MMAASHHMDARTEKRQGIALAQMEKILGWLVEFPAAFAVIAEVIILLSGVTARFVFHQPLVWADELASTVFLWLAMFGAAVALRRGEHMRMTALVGKLSGEWQARIEALAVGTPCLFLALLLWPAMEYAQQEWVVQSPALGLPGTLREAALPVGCVLMLAISGLRLLRFRLRNLAFVAGVLALVAAALFQWGDVLQSIGNWNLVFFFVVLVSAGVLAGVPIAFCFGLVTVAYLLTTTSTPLEVVAGRINEGMSSLILLAVPLFILLGQLIEMTQMAKAMVGFLASLLGHVRGGLSYVLLGAMMLVSGISGAKTADMAAVAPVLFPEMKKRGMEEGELVSLLAASGAMAETIPPSLVLITIGSVTGVSIAALFTGGLLPGVVLAVVLAVLARYRIAEKSMENVKRASAAVVLRSFVVALPALAIPVLIRTAVVEGVATATEVSTIGIVYTILVGVLVYRRFDLRRVYPMLVETAALSGAILFIIGTATCMAWALTQSGFSHALAQAIGSMPGGRWGFLLISIVTFIVLGSVLEGIPAMVLFGPLLFPIARQLGVHEVHYAMVVILAMGIGLFAPPFGLGYYSACTIGRVSPDAGMKRIWPYLGALLLALLVVAAVPWISTGFLT
ncbi:TRAP transporter large permease subunit [Herbaspirillum sp. RTI4]|uniref:TRAP transporter large permease n=1 Tax=Herbaspirillum sp. RTI4 TaxID=3048640 RepID=UPI002AB407A2|nr:TRAP transporter large permease subunit [Herbaspirillum sp. RTI4]MDY7579410.1 TRAP transporter large permease subunit [Herbaspirillum sp. RTI4]MEA9980324.1 TRAP transporter large permease subunit [Herbaspirillum sp. RTI4]